MPAALVFLALAVTGLALASLRYTNPERHLRLYRDPRMIARVDALAARLVAAGWSPRASPPDTVPTIRTLARDDPRGGPLALRIGCTPRGHWMALEFERDLGLREGESIGTALRGDRDGPIPITPDVRQRDGDGFIVRPIEALPRVSAPLVRALTEWPRAWHLTIQGRTITIRADVRDADAIESVVADAIARLVG
ncbi:MAG: hypothetical protein R3B09_04580 [Nannocystaceae bacterium]